MTTIFEESVSCACCHTVTEVVQVGSTNAMGSMDLDMRPPPIQRDTIGYQFHECPHCGYCAPNLEKADGIDVGLIQTAAYQVVRSDTRYPALARRFLAFAHLMAIVDAIGSVIWASLHAAWACDDAGNEHRDAAVACRVAATEALTRLHEQGKTYTDDVDTDEVLRLDLLRRSGHFAAAIEATAQLRTKALPGILDQICAPMRRGVYRRCSAGVTHIAGRGQTTG